MNMDTFGVIQDRIKRSVLTCDAIVHDKIIYLDNNYIGNNRLIMVLNSDNTFSPAISIVIDDKTRLIML